MKRKLWELAPKLAQKQFIHKLLPPTENAGSVYLGELFKTYLHYTMLIFIIIIIIIINFFQIDYILYRYID